MIEGVEFYEFFGEGDGGWGDEEGYDDIFVDLCGSDGYCVLV